MSRGRTGPGQSCAGWTAPAALRPLGPHFGWRQLQKLGVQLLEKNVETHCSGPRGESRGWVAKSGTGLALSKVVWHVCHQPSEASSLTQDALFWEDTFL